MKKYRFFLIGCMLFAFLSANAFTIAFNISNYDRSKKISFFLTAEEKEHVVGTDQFGNGVFSLDDEPSQYVYMQYGEKKQVLFVESGKKLIVYWEDGELPLLRFEGDGAKINEYLNSRKLIGVRNRDNKLNESDFLKKLDDLYAYNCQVLKDAELPDFFDKIEMERLKYFIYDKMFFYPLYHKHLAKDTTYVPTGTFYDKVKILVKLDEHLLFLPEYRNFLINGISYLSQWDGKKTQNGSLRSAMYVDQYVESVRIREMLINYYVFTYIKNRGLNGADELVALFKKHVTSTELVQKFDELCGTWTRLADGCYAPDFSCVDINGKAITLEELKGKPIYIDVWATWCVPCRKEIPYLQELEQEYGDKINFVSISIDKDKKSWKKMIQKGEMNGIQLHYDGNESFLNTYMIKGIPRFILLDKTGRIVSSNAVRPSNSKIVELFNQLL